jgi:hypothetical protein
VPVLAKLTRKTTSVPATTFSGSTLKERISCEKARHACSPRKKINTFLV